MRSRPLVAGAVVTALLAVAGCSTGTGTVAGTGSAGADPRSPAALRYGLAPTPDPRVTYQPDVVIVGGGGDSIRSVTDDGLTWRLDPDAARVGELERGKVMFVTGRAVGRVLDVRPAQDDLAVTIGPVGLTEVIRDGRFETEAPVSLTSPVGYAAGTPFWAEPADAQPADAQPAGFARTEVGPTGRPAGTGPAGSAGGPSRFAAPAPGIPALPDAQLPALPDLPGLPAVPATPKLPALPAVPGRPPAFPPFVDKIGKSLSGGG